MLFIFVVIIVEIDERGRFKTGFFFVGAYRVVGGLFVGDMGFKGIEWVFRFCSLFVFLFFFMLGVFWDGSCILDFFRRKVLG